MFPRGSQPDRVFFSEEEKQESIQIEGSALEGAILISQDAQGEISTMVVVKFSDKMEGLVDNIDNTLCGRLYKDEDKYLVPWSGTYLYAKMN